MRDAGEMAQVTVNGAVALQPIDGFGVNINSKYWDETRILPAMELLLDDLGATLYRVDIWGKSNWVDPDGTLGPGSLSEGRYAEVYGGEIFRRGWAMMRYLNERGIEPYLTASGDVPPWMLAPDGKTLADLEGFCEMLASMVEWAKRREGLRFRLFGPANETDIGSPEGPRIAPAAFVRMLEILDEQLTRRGLDDIRLVVAEQALFNADYVREIVRNERLVRRVGVFGMHSYGTVAPETSQEVVHLVKASPYAGCRLWLTEYGDLEQTGEREWFVAWQMTRRLFAQLRAGFNGALAWDAYDNYHDHNEAWTIYGLLRTGLWAYTPKKRYYASKQVYRYVLPGFERVEVSTPAAHLEVLAFASPDRTQFTLVGMNDSRRHYYLNVALDGFPEALLRGKVAYYRTSAHEDCYRIGHIPMRGGNWPFTGIDVRVPPASIFTLTTVREG
jgi:O-glycosyl hydrolase